MLKSIGAFVFVRRRVGRLWEDPFIWEAPLYFPDRSVVSVNVIAHIWIADQCHIVEKNIVTLYKSRVTNTHVTSSNVRYIA